MFLREDVEVCRIEGDVNNDIIHIFVVAGGEGEWGVTPGGVDFNVNVRFE